MLKATTLFTALFFSINVMSAQDDSYETFHGIRLENSTDPGKYIKISAPPGIVDYTLTFPATKSPEIAGRHYTFSKLTTNSGLSWVSTPFGAPGQIAFFDTDQELIGKSNMAWDTTLQSLTISGTGTGILATFSKASTTLLASETVMSLTSTSPSVTANVNKTLLNLSASGTLGSGSTVTGLAVAVAGGTTNRAATFTGGNVGIGTTAPNVMLDVNGAVAYREYNYTGSLNTLNNDVDFTGGSNTSSFIRVSSSISANVGITGFAGGYSGKILNVYNATNFGLLIKNQNSNSTAANRIKSSTSQDMMISPGVMYQFIYSGYEQRWVAASSSPGGVNVLGQDSADVTVNSVLPSSTASYIQVGGCTDNGGCDVTLENGTSVGQILVVQNNSTKPIKFTGTNQLTSNNDGVLEANNSVAFMWTGAKWVQMAAAAGN